MRSTGEILSERSSQLDRQRAEERQRAADQAMRDEFAKAALTGLLAQADKPGAAAEFARQAYIFADAMMAARLPTA